MEIMQMLPPLDAIRNFENMFSYNIIERLSKDIAQTILMNPHMLEDAIYKQLESMVNPPKKKKVVETKSKGKVESKAEVSAVVEKRKITRKTKVTQND